MDGWKKERWREVERAVVFFSLSSSPSPFLTCSMRKG